MADIQFIRNKKYGTIGIGKNGWSKEVCNVSWNQKAPKLDIREWSPDYQKMSRGITLTKQEAKRLLAILANIDFEEFDSLGVYPDTPVQVRPVYQHTVPQGTVPAPVQTPVTAPASAAPAANTVNASAPQSLVVTEPEIVSMQDDAGMPDGFLDTDTEDVAVVQSMSGPVTAI